MKPYFAILVTLALLLPESAPAGHKDAAALIERAHESDNMYSTGPEVSQQKALSLYQSALQAGPDEKQRLHILYRMAQLYGSAYELQKGEQPDFVRAIQLYQQIIDSCPADEPVVFEAMISIGSHYTTLWELETALKWFKKALEYDTPQLEEQLKRTHHQIRALDFYRRQPGFDPCDDQQWRRAIEQLRKTSSLKHNLRSIRRYQEIAVEQIAYSASRIDPLRAHGELRALIEQYSGTFIAERARQLLRESMDIMPDLWAPVQDFPDNLSFRPAAPLVTISVPDSGVKNQADIVPEPADNPHSLEQNTAESSQPDKHTPRQTRAPPPSYLSLPVIGAAGLILLALAVLITIRKNLL